MKKGETNFDNMMMSSFGKTIMFRFMWQCNEMGVAIRGEKVLEFDKFLSNISV